MSYRSHHVCKERKTAYRGMVLVSLAFTLAICLSLFELFKSGRVLQ